MDRTSQSLGDMKNTNFRSNQEAIAELNYLLKFGSQELEDAFKETLREEAKPVEPLYYITKQIRFPAISENNSSKLRLINTYSTDSAARLSRSNDEARTVSIYAEIRGPYVATTLQNLATASVGTVRKTNPDAIYRQGTSGIGTYATALEQLFAAEYDNICPIFVRDQWMRLHSLTCQGAMSELSRVLRELHTHVKSNIITDCYLAYEIVDIIAELSFRLESKNAELRQPVQDALRPIRETAKYSLQRLLEDVRQRVGTLMAIPGECSHVPITLETMTRLQTMTLFLKPLSSILASVGEGGWLNGGTGGSSSGRPLDVGINGQELFVSYVSDTIETLLSGLEVKARALLKTKTAMGVFVANNVSLVDRMVFTSQLHSILTDSARTKLDNWRKKGTSMYLEAWREPSAHLRDVQYTNRGSNSNQRPPSGSTPSSVDSAAYVRNLSSKDKDTIKEKFKNFNTSFDELVKTHKTFRMEPDVRERMAREIGSLIEPLYARFWDRYHEIDKGKGKYVKYDKQTLSSTLASLG